MDGGPAIWDTAVISASQTALGGPHAGEGGFLWGRFDGRWDLLRTEHARGREIQTSSQAGRGSRVN